MSADGRPQVLQQDGVTIVAFQDAFRRITEDRIAQINEPMAEAAKADPPKILIDLAPIEFFSSSFIEVLFRVWEQIKEKDGAVLAICGLAPYCHEILQVTNLDNLWDVYDSREAALSAMSG